ncbi:hemolysin-III family protein [Schizosaccharomyces japonicus yFS275]|uniref:Hemolysin-III family protein n=1 Tax=Schizosaccharomyces japonicus (strain yFS275 / FY16936) TaxID=402676 RepID=B6K1C2_SCHJY|nr:hemolysin-III family protein [Schizosaccharomyces japonicus yFS275]EEB07743.1 hemolysin-III family protein [Schizosaccharomyces japonicus yFS275]
MKKTESTTVYETIPQNEKTVQESGNDFQTTSKQSSKVKLRRHKGYPLLKWNEIQPWQQDNQYIVRAYRPASNSFLRSIQSIGHIHNETVNIWTHLLGALYFLYMIHGVRNLLSRDTTTAEDRYVVLVFIVSAFTMLAMSTAYHTLCNHSPRVAKFGNKLDYLGIVVMIVGSFVPSIHYGFACHASFQVLYTATIFSIGVIAVFACCLERFRKPQWRVYRAGIFTAMGLFGILPVAHAATLYPLGQLLSSMGLGYLILQGVLYIIGAVLYAMRFPEKTKPGIFDVLGSSHQWFHLFVLTASLCHFRGIYVAYAYFHDHPSCLA